MTEYPPPPPPPPSEGEGGSTPPPPPPGGGYTPPPPPPGGGYTPPPGGYPPGGYPPPGYGGYSAQPQRNQKALWSMITGILGVTVCCGGLIPAIIAIVLGNAAKKEIAASGGMQTGEGQAKAGVILGIVGLVLGVLLLGIYILALVADSSTSM